LIMIFMLCKCSKTFQIGNKHVQKAKKM
jgi:hypothetical protein